MCVHVCVCVCMRACVCVCVCVCVIKNALYLVPNPYYTCTCITVHTFFSREGIGFYRKLQGSVSRLKKRAEEVCDARQRERHSVER